MLRGHCKVARFCCKGHLEEGVKKKPKAAKAATRRGREPLTVPQLALLFDVVVNVLGAAWAGALMMIQLHLGERADCSRQISSSWFENLRPSAGLPCVNIEKVNGKTQERCVPLPRSFAELLWTWISKKPLVGGGGRTQWPWPGQGLAEAFQPRGKPCLLFPGRVIGGCPARNFNKAITERAYADVLREAADHIGRERARAQLERRTHIFDDIDLDRIGTHSMKKSSITIMRTANVPTSVVAVLTGTSPRTIEEIYDVPTMSRRRMAVQSALASVAESVA